MITYFIYFLWLLGVGGFIAISRMGDWHHREAVWWNAQYDTARMVEAMAEELPSHRAILDALAQRMLEEASFRYAYNESQSTWSKIKEGGRVRDGRARGTREGVGTTSES